MFSFLTSFYNYTQLILSVRNYINIYERTFEHNIVLLDDIIQRVSLCGSVAIKFCQWITPKLELIHTEENELFNKDRIKPLWLRKLETFYENCENHSIEYTFQEYETKFHEDFNDKYEILDIIGSGSIGQVYLIQDKPLKDYTTSKKYVMKIIHPNVNYDIRFFRRFYSFLTWLPCIHNQLKNIFPFDIHQFIDQFEQQSNFIKESNHLLLFQEFYKENDSIVIPKLIKLSETIMIMSYEEGISYENSTLNKHEKYKLAMLFGLFTRNNQHILNYNHGDLHKGNWKIIEDTINQNHKLVIYDFGFCWNVPKDKHHLIELTYDTFESSDRKPKKIDSENLTNILNLLVVYDRENNNNLKERINDYVKQNIEESQIWTLSPIRLFKFAIELCISEDILIDPVMVQTIILSVQCQLLFQENGLQASSTNEISSFEVYRGRYIDMLTFCKTKNIFHDYQQNMIHKLNDKQTKVEGVFDFISMPDSIKQLALNK
tara:strand:+ start:536 stop:2002 length:1467 start_codon:yes stop_codon:yes gene_type:complete